MPTGPPTISDALRAAIAGSGLSLLAIERATGVQRASLSRFVRGERSLRLDLADKLAVYFNLQLRPTDRG
ncbi:MAG: helix-turn-helix domain-containing protein [Gemmataceae bacterium]|nr:helix-turn-helix domain-containing protein [Gemmataceae bacterium]